MTDRQSPLLDPRRADDFRRELIERAGAWIRGWNLDDETGGFGRALLDASARFSAQVAERLDHAGEKLSLGLLDWLAVRGRAALPARMPVAFKLADNATDPVLARHPVQLQANIDGASVVFETESDVRLVPGTLELLVGVDAPNDAYSLAPPGLSSLAPLEPLPKQWRTKSFVQAGSPYLQLDPALGLIPDMLIEAGGSQYRVISADGDLVKLEPAIDAAGGLAANTVVSKVDLFDPFGDATRNQQMHRVYLGDGDLFNIESEAVLEIHGAGNKLSAAKWEYFGKAEGSDTPDWHELPQGSAATQGSDKLTLLKPTGSVEPTKIDNVQGRWIRASQKKVDSPADILSTEAITVVVNPGAKTAPCPAAGVAPKPGAESTAEGFTNTAPLVFTSAFYPLGREPKQFDTFYLGSADAFSKKRADVSICFEMTDPTADAFGVMREGLFANRLLASIGGDGALHLLEMDSTSGTLTKFLKRPPLQPKSDTGASVLLDAKPPYRPPIWAVNENGLVPDTLGGTLSFGLGLFGILGGFLENPFYVAAAGGQSVWLWKEFPSFTAWSRWIPLGDVPANANAKGVEGLVYLRNEGDAAGSQLFAASGGALFKHSAVAQNNKQPWTQVPLLNAPDSGDPSDPYLLSAIEPINRFDGLGRWHGSLLDGMVGVFKNKKTAVVYFIAAGGNCTSLKKTVMGPDQEIEPKTRPVAAHLGAEVHVFWELPQPPPPAPPLVKLHATVVDANNFATHNHDDDSTPGANGPGAIAGGLLEIPPSMTTAMVLATGTRENLSWILSWTPSGTPADYFEDPVQQGVGPLGGAPSAVGNYLLVPGTQSDAWSAQWDAAQSHHFQVDIKSGVVVSAALSPAILRHDYVGVTGSAGYKTAEIDALDFTLAGDRFYSVDKEFGIGSANQQLMLYRHASASAGDFSTTKNATGPRIINLPAGDLDTRKHDWLLVEDSGPQLQFMEVKDVHPAATRPTIEFYVGSTSALNPGPVKYWRPVPIAGRAAPYFQIDPTGDGDWDASLLGQVKLTVDGGHDPSPQGAKAFDKTLTGKPKLIVFDAPWNAGSTGDANQEKVSFNAAIRAWARQLSENSSDPTLVWEYWNGRAWDQITVKDETENLKLTGRLEFTVPTTLAPTDVNGKTNHWIRARLIAGDYGHEVVSVVTRPDANNSSATIQQVVRDTSDFHPPLVVNMRIRYTVSVGVAPTYLLTEDGGSTRDQSDANRTEGTLVEAFVPLAVQLGRLEHASATSGPAPCATDCDCGGTAPVAATAGTTGIPAGASADALSMPTTSVPAAILLGFNATLSEEPINVLLLVEERVFDPLAPLKVEALINDRFEPLTVGDSTRALGESGLLALSFPVKPTPRELFGKALVWLRLSPSKASADIDWQPVIRGAYLNAAFASATETLTREALGSSDGRPHLTVQVARPPLLADSLELRVREPLDDEERARLLEVDPASVNFTEADLPGDWVLWRQVADPDDHGPAERVYALDETAGKIEFGDGLRGMIPPIGRDAVVAFRYQRTEPPAAGSDEVPGNEIPARTVLQLVTPVEGVEAAFAADHSAGGAPPEPDDRVLRFGNAGLRHRGRALAPQDFEDIALASSPDIAQARAFRTTDGLRLVVVMRGAKSDPSAAQRRELQRLLQSAASPLLGAPKAILIEAARVRRLRLALKLRVAGLDDAGTLGDAVRQSLTKLFDTAADPARGGWPLGVTPGEDDVALALEGIPTLAGIDEIGLTEIDTQDNERAWPSTLRADELVLLADDAFRIRFETQELTA